MDRKYFVLYLIPPRPDFVQSMSDEERGIMTQHVAYWKEWLDKGVALVFGPVFDPAATYGIGIVAVETEEQLRSIIKNDPATAINKYEYYPMRAVTAK